MRFREIRTSERITDQDRRREEEFRKQRGFMQIKPESDITYEEAKAYVENLFKETVEC